MTYEIIFKYKGKDKGKERNFTIDVSEQENIIFENFDEFNNVVNFLKSTENLYLHDKEYFVIEQKSSITSDKLTCIIYVREEKMKKDLGKMPNLPNSAYLD